LPERNISDWSPNFGCFKI